MSTGVVAVTRSLPLSLVLSLALACGSNEPAPAGGAGAASGGSGGSGAGSGGASGTAGSSGFLERGVCGQRGESTVSVTEFDGFEEYYLIGDRGFGTDICIIRFDATRVGDPPEGCPDCEWSHLVELGNPTVVEDLNGVCENSQLAFGADRIAEIDGSRVAYGYVFEFAGHNSVLLKYFEDLGMWDAFGNATWDEVASAFDFDRRDGVCGY